MDRAYVINIMNNKNIIIDYGISQGAKRGQKVRVILEGEKIFNLDNIEIGTLDRIKETLEIVEIYDNFSICQKIISTLPLYSFAQLDLSQEIKKVQELNVDTEDITNLTFPSEQPIRKGDMVEILDWQLSDIDV